MLDESIRMIQEAEKQAEQEKAACRAALQRMLAETEAEAAAQTGQVEDALHRERQDLISRAEQAAAELRTQILEDAERKCNLLQAQAKENQDRAIEYILAKGV